MKAIKRAVLWAVAEMGKAIWRKVLRSVVG